MKGVDIVNRLKQVISKYTEDFSTIIDVTSLNRSSTTVTAITATAHGLSSNDYVTISGAKEPIALTSLTRSGTTVTVVAASDHKLSDPTTYASIALPVYIEISGVTPSGYNGTFELLTVPDSTTFTFRISDTPASPATIAGFLLRSDFDGYNGYKQVTVTDSTTFTYQVSSSTIQTPAQGDDIKANVASFIHNVATPNRITEFYDKGAGSGTLDTRMFVVMDSEVVFKNGTVASDVTSAKKTNEDYYYEVLQDFSIYIVAPSKTDLLGGTTADTVREYRLPILKSIANYAFPSNFSDVKYQSTIYVGNEPDDYIKAYYVHRFDFTACGFVQRNDVADFNPGVPLELVSGTVTDKDMTYTPRMRTL